MIKRRSTVQLRLYFLTSNSIFFCYISNSCNEPKYNRRFGRYLNYRDIRNMMLDRLPELKVTYDLKEYYINMNSMTLLSDAPEAVDKAIELFECCGIAEYDEFYRLLNNWREEIVNSFTTINGQRIKQQRNRVKKQHGRKAALQCQWVH